MRRLAALLAVLFLVGCARPARLPAEASIPHVGGTPPPEEEFRLPAELPAPREQAALVYGSVGLAEEPTVLVSVYLDEAGGRTWDEAGIRQTRESLAVAAQWLREQMAAYGTEFTLYFDTGEDADLCVRRTVDHRFNGDDEGDGFHTELDTLCAALDTELLRARYGTDRVGFVFFVPSPGVSYTMPHYIEDGEWYYHEYSLLYQTDASAGEDVPEAPAVYAHEILHMYGAPDLYEGSSDYFVTDELVDYVCEKWPDAIMQDTYNADGSADYDAIRKSLCPLTAYRLGLCDGFEGLEKFPAVGDLPPGAFAEGPDADAPAPLADAGGIAV